jgi:hypothetical protein
VVEREPPTMEETMSYQEAPATRMLATNCVCCGRPLVDACSVELGMGPECRNGIFPEGVCDDDRKKANELVHAAAVAAQKGAAEKVVSLAGEIRELGFGSMADKVERRFKDGVAAGVRKADITIAEDGDVLVVGTPYRRGDADAFISAWRAIPGRSYDRASRSNRIPKAQRAALWELLKRFFPGKWGTGPKGAFRVPRAPKVEDPQLEMDFEAKANED